MPEFRSRNKPYWQTTDKQTVRLYHGDVLSVLPILPEKSVHCVVTSPPYWGLRDYGVTGQIGFEPSPDCGTQGKAQCGKCFVCTMVAVFREVKRVLRDDGTCWLNLGDTYASGNCGGESVFANGGTDGKSGDRGIKRTVKSRMMLKTRGELLNSGLSQGNLVGVPWRVALALQSDGWILRQDIIWAKPAPMPESVQNRCTKAHEYVFLLTKRKEYFYDAEAIKQKSTSSEQPSRRLAPKQASTMYDGMISHNENHARAVLGRVERSNKRSVWTVSSQPYPGAHYATFPEKLITPMIRAGSSEKGCCGKCGTPWMRIEKDNWRPNCECFGELVKVKVKKKVLRLPDASMETVRDHSVSRNRNGIETSTLNDDSRKVETEIEKTEIVYKSDLDLEDHPITPCTVLDPFIGSGTVCIVSIDYGRSSVGIDLSKKYLDTNCIPRVEGKLLSIPSKAHLAGKTSGKVELPGKVAAKKGF